MAGCVGICVDGHLYREECRPAIAGAQYPCRVHVISIKVLTNIMHNTFARFGGDEESRRDELIRTIEHSVEQLSLAELEALYYDLVAKDYIR